MSWHGKIVSFQIVLQHFTPIVVDLRGNENILDVYSTTITEETQKTVANARQRAFYCGHNIITYKYFRNSLIEIVFR